MGYGSVPDLTTGRKINSASSKSKALNLEREKVVDLMLKGELKFTDLTAEQLLDTKLVRAVEKALSCCKGPLREDLYICCFVSPTAWGKSYSIWKTFGFVGTVEFGSSQEWFINTEEDVMLFDEFCGQVRCQKMLKYLDCYPISLPIKGGHRPCYWKAIFICSNTSPDQWYMKEDPKTGLRSSSIPDDVRKALYRRIGYPNPTERGETHVYDARFTNKEAARVEMNAICRRIYNRIYPGAAIEDAAPSPEVIDVTPEQAEPAPKKPRITSDTGCPPVLPFLPHLPH